MLLFRTLVLLTAGALTGCAAHTRVRSDYGINRCPESAAADLLAVTALQCWFDAPHGRWRTLAHESHYAVLVVHVEALNLGDADQIARRFVADGRNTFSEILVYVQPESVAGRSRTRRVRWTRDDGFDALDFMAPAAP